MNYTKICFVIMPFGKKAVGERQVDFDFIYEKVFEPAINATALPEGGFLESRRTDKDFFTGDISMEMFQYIEYSRFAIADITGLNANVFYELGVRHRSHQAGTAIFRQTDVKIPFDIQNIKAFPYEYEPEDNIAQSIQLITQILTESLEQNRIDSPVQIALKIQQSQVNNIDSILRDAENAIRNKDIITAISKYNQAISVSPNNPLLHHELGILYKDLDDWEKALASFSKATVFSPDYSDAFREKGIAENKIFNKSKPRIEGLPTGEDSLLRTIELDPDDYDAYASLGGIYKREENFEESLKMYKQSTEVSKGNPYPLMNELKLYLLINQTPSINDRYKLYLRKAERVLLAQVNNEEPYNTPWSFFDLSEVNLYLGNSEDFLKYLDEGILTAQKWQMETHLQSLELLLKSKLTLVGLKNGIEKLSKAIEFSF